MTNSLSPVIFSHAATHQKGSAQTHRARLCVRVHGQRALDVGCAPARGGISRKVRQPVSLALDVRLVAVPGRLVAVPGWIFVVLEN
jgi:hypothetical protein